MVKKMTYNMEQSKEIAESYFSGELLVDILDKYNITKNNLTYILREIRAKNAQAYVDDMKRRDQNINKWYGDVIEKRYKNNIRFQSICIEFGISSSTLGYILRARKLKDYEDKKEGKAYKPKAKKKLRPDWLLSKWKMNSMINKQFASKYI